MPHQSELGPRNALLEELNALRLQQKRLSTIYKSIPEGFSDEILKWGLKPDCEFWIEFCDVIEETIAVQPSVENESSLMSAAPWLLESVKDLLGMAIIPSEGPVFDQARVAIAKAEGNQQ